MSELSVVLLHAVALDALTWNFRRRLSEAGYEVLAPNLRARTITSPAGGTPSTGFPGAFVGVGSPMGGYLLFKL
jgi:hypothetical protein